jgi:hypothetical protein
MHDTDLNHIGLLLSYDRFPENKDCSRCLVYDYGRFGSILIYYVSWWSYHTIFKNPQEHLKCKGDSYNATLLANCTVPFSL